MRRILRDVHCSGDLRTALIFILVAYGINARLVAQPSQPGASSQIFGNPVRPSSPIRLTSTPLWIDTSDRVAVVSSYLNSFLPSASIVPGWTGNLITGDAGNTTQAYRDAVLLRINWFRQMAGIGTPVTFTPSNNSADQQAAMMMSVNAQVNHSPPTTWTYYTTAGADAAAHSNLCLNIPYLNDPGCVAQYMQDFGALNGTVGHRRWLLYPQTQNMGTGDVQPPYPGAFANAIWVLDTHFYDSRPVTRDTFIAWPPRGFVPAELVPGRWSFSYPNADFTNAVVTMQRSGGSVAVRIESPQNGFGENSIVWVPDNINTDVTYHWPTPTTDIPIGVTISHARIGGADTTFSYTVTPIALNALQSPVGLGSNSTFVILAGASVVLSGGGVVNGNIGISPGSAFGAGVPAATVNGNVYAGGAVAAQAQADLAIAYNDAAGRQGAVVVSTEVGGQTLSPGIYRSASSLAISSGDLVLDGQGNPNAIFIFQIASTLDLAANRQVVLAGGAKAGNIFWQVGGAATLGAFSVLHGSILSAGSITLLTGARLDGRALAKGTVAVNTGGTNTVSVPVASALQFIPVAPCRVVDTRNAAGAFGGPKIAGLSSRSFAIPSGSCGIPNSAQAYSFNVAVVPDGPFAYLSMWPAGQIQPFISTLNSDGRVKSNAAIIPAGDNGAVSVFSTHNAHVVLDINGYFVPAGTPGAVAYYPVAPCRISDTRGPNGALGGPFLAGQTSRTIAMQSSSCGLPANAQAYSLNLAVVPHSTLGFLTAWPTGITQPLVASLNDSTGTVLSNAAIVPAGLNGSIDVFATNDTDLIIDINGYFAPPGPRGLSLYNLNPCRVLDTRAASGSFTGTLTAGVAASSCGTPASAQAYVFNATAIPQTTLGFSTLWAQGAAARPNVASLNATDGAITGNLAIVPTSNGSVSAFATNPTHLVLDIFGYFAP